MSETRDESPEREQKLQCSSSSVALVKSFEYNPCDDDYIDPVVEEEYERQVRESDGFDVDYFRYAWIKPCPLKDENAYTYDVELFGKLGLHCYNLLHKNIGRGMIWEEEANDVYYKGKLPKWLTKYDVLAAAKDEYYVVQESDFLENDLYAEIALYSNWKWHASSLVRSFLPLKIKYVIVQTRKSGEESPHLKLTANNAIFYMSFKGSGDHPSGKHYEYQEIVRKTTWMENRDTFV